MWSFTVRQRRIYIVMVGPRMLLITLGVLIFLHSCQVNAWVGLPFEARGCCSLRSRVSPLASTKEPQQPTLVVGATGRVGRLVVQKLLDMNKPVRALVRHRSKFHEIFGADVVLEHPSLEIIVADVAKFDKYEDILDSAVKGCDSVISVMGAVRFAKLSDFVPWRLFNMDPSSWADRLHPYFGNYLGQKKLIELSEKHGIQRFVRLTGLGLAYSAFNPFSILFNSLLSLNNRWGILTEIALHESSIPYTILRPGGLAENTRDTNTTNLQVDASGKLPFPGRVGRDDVAALCVESLELPSHQSLTLACRWCGDGVKPKPQGLKEEGQATARECIDHLVATEASAVEAPRMKPYAAAVGLAVYSFAFVGVRIALSVSRLIVKLIRG